MLFKGTSARRWLMIAVGLLACAALTHVVCREDNYYLIIDWLSLSVASPGPIARNIARKVLLPSGCDIPDEVLRKHLRGTSGEHWATLQLNESEALSTPPHRPGLFDTTKSFLYNTAPDAGCLEKQMPFKLGVDGSQAAALNVSMIFEIFREEAEAFGDSYNQHLRVMLEDYMTEERKDSHWYRFSGSSVWLRDYNVHMVVSRMIMSENGDKKHPKISLSLAQIFDEQWREVLDVRIVFPSNEAANGPGFQVGGHHYHLYRFPRFFPVPFAVENDRKYWGAEDPRVMLVKNDSGREEPVIVFNAYHEKRAGDAETAELQGYRSMFLCLPFRVQKGKQIENADTGETSDAWFSQTKQIRVAGEADKTVEKNWVPFVSGAGEYHDHVLLLTLLDPLKIIRCELWTENSECAVQASSDDDSVGPLRGGTPLVSIKRVESADAEFFAGIARAHLKECGCGHHFYRPNLIVVARVGDKWSLSRVSSSLDLGITDVLLGPTSNVCENESVIIPNGIEFWDLDQDLMSVDVSASDLTVERVHVTGVLRALEQSGFGEYRESEGSLGTVACALESSKEFCRKFGIEAYAAFKERVNG